MPENPNPPDGALREVLAEAGRLEQMAADWAEALEPEPELRRALERLRVVATHSRAQHGLS